MENQKRKTTINCELYRQALNYKNDTNLDKYIEEAQNFYNGNQYPNSNYKNQIRVTMNLCSFSSTIKASKICSTPIYLTYTADDNKTDCTALRRFDEYNCNKLHLKENNFQAALNGFVNGTEVTFIRWDSDDTSYKGIYKGGLAEEHIELRNFAVANPYVQDIQNQAWIMYWDEIPLKAIVDMLEGDKKERKEKIEALKAEAGMIYGDEQKEKEHVNSALVRLFTRYFRIDGEVYFMCQTETVDVFSYPHPLSKKTARDKVKKIYDEYKKVIESGLDDEDLRTEDKVIDMDIDFEDFYSNSVSNEKITDNEYKEIKEKFSLYPFAVYEPFKQNGSFYGRSDIKSLIPIQKGLNFAISMMLKCAENNAYNKIFAKPDALQGQTITNEPSQIVIDYSTFTNGWGVKMAESQPMPNGLLDFADRLLAMTRVVYGFNDVMDGSITNQDMSGYMLQQMIKQANTPLEQQQQLFWLYNVEKAAIRLMYYKHYVDKAKYTYELDDSEYEVEEQARIMLKTRLENGKKLETMPNAKAEDFAKPTHKTKVADYNVNKELFGVNFDIAIDAMQGLSDSKLVEQQFWDNLFMNGNIQNISPDMLALYLQASPNVSERTKVALKNVLAKLERAENTQLKNQLQQVAQYLEQVMAYAKNLEAQNGMQSNYLKNLTAEFTNKINGANKIIMAQQKDLQNYKEPKSKGEVKSNNARGISGTTTMPQEQMQ